jgi:hypothetical protein
MVVGLNFKEYPVAVCRWSVAFVINPTEEYILFVPTTPLSASQ